MNKKIWKIILIIITLTIFVGCNKEEKQIEKTKTQEENIETEVEDLNIKLDTKGSFNGITYMYPSNAMTSNLGIYTIMDYMNGNEFVFRIGMYFFENKSLSAVMATDSIENKGTRNINGKDWQFYEGIQSDGKKTVNYAYQEQNDTYTITFIFDKDINNFINTFMNNVKFK